MSLEKLLSLNINDYTDKKGGLTYLSWANAWQEFIKVYADAKYHIKKNEQTGLPVFGNSELGYMVYTEVTVCELTHEMFLPVLDFRNNPLLKPNAFDVNKAVMRCLTKNLAMFGLGLYLYAGEDLPEQEPKPKILSEAEIKRGCESLINGKNTIAKLTKWVNDSNFANADKILIRFNEVVNNG